MTFPAAHILCVDDDNDWCELLEVMLRQSGENLKLKSVPSVQDALNLMKKQSFDLYILDYALPAVTGIELCKKIRLNDTTTPIIFYSGMAREIDSEKAMKAGATEYLVKPDDLDRLIEMVKQLISNALKPNPCGHGMMSIKKTQG